MRWFMTWTVLGALVGVTIATIFAPMVLRTFLASTGAEDAMCQCAELVSNTAALLIKTQLWGLVIGAVTFPSGAGLARWLWSRHKKHSQGAGGAPGSSGSTSVEAP